VALSRWSVALTVPVPLWGAIGFVAIVVAALRKSRWLLVLSGAAALVSLVLLVVEVVAVGALCFLCEAVHLVSFALVALAWRARTSLSPTFGRREDLVLIFAPPVGLLIALALFVPRYWGTFGWKGDLPFAHGKTDDGYPWIGATSPTLVVQEFTDYSCEHCRAASARTLRRLADHPKTLRLVRHQYPRVHCRIGDEKSCLAVRIAYCAEAQDKFWQADRWLFEHATERVRLDPRRAAHEVGLDEQALATCLTRRDIYERAAAEATFALKKKLPGTPYYIGANRRMHEEEFAKLVDALP
jgi:hypothetical protein